MCVKVIDKSSIQLTRTPFIYIPSHDNIYFFCELQFLAWKFHTFWIHPHLRVSIHVMYNSQDVKYLFSVYFRVAELILLKYLLTSVTRVSNSESWFVCFTRCGDRTIKTMLMMWYQAWTSGYNFAYKRQWTLLDISLLIVVSFLCVIHLNTFGLHVIIYEITCKFLHKRGSCV
jgi:hypothetical protein